MYLTIQRKKHLSIREQIKRQIIALIENQDLLPGQALLSARDLSNLIHINRNTITQAYKELESEGILEVVIGSGTYVKKDLVLKPKKELDRIFDDSIRQSVQLGFSKAEVIEHFLNRLSTIPAELINKRVLIVDCNKGVTNYLSNRILEGLEGYDVNTTEVLIQEIEEDPESAAKLMKDLDLIVCGFNHVEELHAAVTIDNIAVIAILLQIDARVINTLTQLPEGAKIGCVCENERSTKTFYNSSYFTGGRELKRILVGSDNSKKLKRLVKECDTIFVTNFVFERVKELSSPDQKLVKVELNIDSSSIDLVKEKLIT